VTAMGVSHEELLLKETASREQVLLSTISDLETKLRNTRQILERVTNEKVNSSCMCKFLCELKILMITLMHALHLQAVKFLCTAQVTFNSLFNIYMLLDKYSLNVKYMDIHVEASI